jgi:subtilisin family serine protease
MLRKTRLVGAVLFSGLASAPALAADGDRLLRRDAAGPAGPAVAGASDWRDDWRRHRNSIIDADPNLAFDPTSVVVKFADGATEAQRAVIRAAIGGGVIETWPLVPGLEHLAIPGRVEDAIDAVSLLGEATGAVEFVEPDFIAHLGGVPNDAGFAQLWGMNNTGQTVNSDPGAAGADVDANLAWDVWTGSSNFVVGMADSGIRGTHEDLAANRWTNPGEIANNNFDDDGNGRVDDTWGWDFYNNDKDPTDDNGHGTHTAGTVGAVGNNGKGVAGVCWNVKLCGLKIANRSGSISLTAAISAIDYCIAKGIKVSNHSWGGGTSSSSFSAAVDRARNAGHLLVCAAGNSGANSETAPQYPASYPQDNVIAVASTTNNDTLSSFSNYGSTRVDLGAPGSTIYSTYIRNNSNTTYAYLSGTSMATPHVAGAAALVWSQNPSWTYLQVRSKLLSTVRPIPALSGKCVTGGVLNVNNAVR